VPPRQATIEVAAIAWEGRGEEKAAGSGKRMDGPPAACPLAIVGQSRSEVTTTMAGRRRYHPACPRISDAKRDRHLRLGGPVTEERLP
jgi:hypothetical protein